MTTSSDGTDYFGRHLRFGWWALLCFLTLGILLEAMHGLKIGWYLDVSNETRRLMWRLAHAHGVLFALVHVAFALTVRQIPAGRWQRSASTCLLAGAVLMPTGFFLGGLVVYGGDPSPGVFLAPIGAALMFFGVLRTAQGVRAALGGPGTPPG